MQDMGKIQRGTCLCDNSFPFSCQRLTNHKHIGDTLADIHRIHLFQLSWFARDTRFLNQLFVRLIYADYWVELLLLAG